MKEREDFEIWLFSIDNNIEGLKEINFPVESLDYSLKSLDVVENWVLNNFQSKEELLKNENTEILDELAKYVGETFRKNLGGYWDIELKNENDAYFRLPVLKNGKNITSPVAPHTLVTACISRKKGNYISTILKDKI